MNTLISVIVPVYNAERYLRCCVESVLTQDVSDVELILVNDGSNDGSLEICREYEAKDTRVVVLDKPNGGVSSARNAAIDIAKGEWVLFLDSDDSLDGRFFEGVKGSEEDLLVRGARFYEEVDHVVSGMEFDAKMPQPQLSDFVKQYVGSTLLRAPWAKFFRCSLIGDLRFPEDMKVGEDSYFVQRYLARCNSYKLLYGSCYHVNKGEPIERKYACTVEYAAQSLTHLVESYGAMENHLHVGRKGFLTFYGFFKLVSKRDWCKSPWIWFCNEQIVKISRFIGTVFPISQKAQMLMWNMSISKLLTRVLFKSK